MTVSATTMLLTNSSGQTRRGDVHHLDARLAAVRDGDAAALERVLRELLPDVRRWLLRLMGPRPDVDDATQDALLELARALPKFRGQSKVTTFAHRITVRVAYRYYKKRARPVELHEVMDDVEAVGNPEQQAMEREALVLLHDILATLPQKRRVAFVLCAIEGLTAGEAAEIEGTSALAIRSRLHHARAAVDKHLARHRQREAEQTAKPVRGGAR